MEHRDRDVAPDNDPAPDDDAARHAALSVGSRRRLLAVLREAVDPRDVATLATAVGLHVTTVRSHLQMLEQAGLVRHQKAARGGRTGRPRALYTAVAEPVPNSDDGRLAALLVGELAVDAEQGPEVAEHAGRRWAASLMPAGGSGSSPRPARQVQALFDRLGFAPRLIEDTDRWQLELTACPFEDLARRYPQIVCTLHRGLLHGVLARHGERSGQATLTPFAGPGLCLVEVTPPGRPAPAPARAPVTSAREQP